MPRPRDRAPRHRAFGRFMRPLIDKIQVEPNPALRKKLREEGVGDDDLAAAIKDGVAQFEKDFEAEQKRTQKDLKPPERQCTHPLRVRFRRLRMPMWKCLACGKVEQEEIEDERKD